MFLRNRLQGKFELLLSYRHCYLFYAAIILFVTLAAAALLSASAIAIQSSTAVATVSAASYEFGVAPSSIAAAFGTRLATATAVATSLPLPTTLSGTTVEINGMRAGLFFVSPGQVNYEVPGNVAPGSATIVVRSGDGTTSTGTVQVRAVVPGIFTANGDGRGVPAALVVRVKADGTQVTESVAQFDQTNNRFAPKPIDLGPAGERVFLVLYLTGLRSASSSAVRVLLGGDEITPLFAGPAPGFAGLDQINVELPRSMAGRGRVSLVVSATGAAASNLVEIEIGGSVMPGTEPRIFSLIPNPVLAGQSLTISGANFAAMPSQNQVRIIGSSGGVSEAQVVAASSTQLTVRVPFGVESGIVRVTTPQGQGSSATMLGVRTSVSGFVENTNQQPQAGVIVRLFSPSGPTISAVTNREGSFILPDVPPSNRVEIEFDFQSGSIPPFPKVRLAMRVRADRDNLLAPITLQQSGGSPVGGDNPTIVQTGNFILSLPAGTTIRLANGTFVTNVSLVQADPNRLPVEFPGGHFSSAVVQILPSGATIMPGGKLTFPNSDRYPAGTQVPLFRLDQPTNNSPGSFAQIGVARVSDDGQRLETEATAIRETSYYFVSLPRQETTVVGRVLEADGRPVSQAMVKTRGRSAQTDNNGIFVLRPIPVSAGDRIVVEASVLRPAGNTDRALGAEVTAGVNGITSAPDIRFAPVGNRPPIINNLPTSLTLNAHETKDVLLPITDPEGQPVQVTLSQLSFASISAGGNDTYTLRLAPNSGNIGAHTLRVTATDSLGASTSQVINITVNSPAKRPPTAAAANIVTNEDTSATITLSGSDPDGDTLRFTVVSDPKNGRLNGVAPNLTYTPAKDLNGEDSFQFKVNDGALDSAAATVSITVNQVNDAPVLSVPESETASEGRTLSFTVSAADVDAEQTLDITAAGLPNGARFEPESATSKKFTWIPIVGQAGGDFRVTFTVRDNGSPALSASKITIIKVGAPVANNQTVELDEDMPVEIVLTGEDRGGLPISFEVLTQPQRGTLTGTAPRLTYKPAPNFSGGDGFRFKVNNGRADSAEATIGLVIKPINDQPALTVPGPQSVKVGESLKFVVSAIDVDEKQTLNISSGSVLPENAIFGQLSPTTREFYWTPAPAQVGTYSFTFVATDDGEPLLSDAKTVMVTVLPGQADGPGWERNVDIGLFVRALVSDGTNLYAGTPLGIFRSNNQGQNFQKLRGMLDGVNVTALAITAQAIFVGTQCPQVDAQCTGEGIFRSTNQGQSWQVVNRDLGGREIYSLTVINQAIYAGTEGGLFRSENNGDTWSPATQGLGRFPVRALVANGGRLFAGTLDGGLFVSDNNAQSWTPVPLGQNASKVLTLTLRSGVLLAGTERGGIFRSTDNGATWAPVSDGLPTGLIVNALAVGGSDIYAGTLLGVFVSSDGGVSWKQINTGLVERRVRSLTVTSNTVHAGTNGGPFKRGF